jgi:hypothetical protein
MLNGAVMFRPAVRIAGPVLRDGPDEDHCSPNNLRPAYRNGKEVRVTK